MHRQRKLARMPRQPEAGFSHLTGDLGVTIAATPAAIELVSTDVDALVEIGEGRCRIATARTSTPVPTSISAMDILRSTNANASVQNPSVSWSDLRTELAKFHANTVARDMLSDSPGIEHRALPVDTRGEDKLLVNAPSGTRFYTIAVTANQGTYFDISTRIETQEGAVRHMSYNGNTSGQGVQFSGDICVAICGKTYLVHVTQYSSLPRIIQMGGSTYNDTSIETALQGRAERELMSVYTVFAHTGRRQGGQNDESILLSTGCTSSAHQQATKQSNMHAFRLLVDKVGVDTYAVTGHAEVHPTGISGTHLRSCQKAHISSNKEAMDAFAAKTDPQKRPLHSQFGHGQGTKAAFCMLQKGPVPILLEAGVMIDTQSDHIGYCADAPQQISNLPYATVWLGFHDDITVGHLFLSSEMLLRIGMSTAETLLLLASCYPGAVHRKKTCFSLQQQAHHIGVEFDCSRDVDIFGHRVEMPQLWDLRHFASAHGSNIGSKAEALAQEGYTQLGNMLQQMSKLTLADWHRESSQLRGEADSAYKLCGLLERMGQLLSSVCYPSDIRSLLDELHSCGMSPFGTCTSFLAAFLRFATGVRVVVRARKLLLSQLFLVRNGLQAVWLIFVQHHTESLFFSDHVMVDKACIPVGIKEYIALSSHPLVIDRRDCIAAENESCTYIDTKMIDELLLMSMTDRAHAGFRWEAACGPMSKMIYTSQKSHSAAEFVDSQARKAVRKESLHRTAYLSQTSVTVHGFSKGVLDMHVTDATAAIHSMEITVEKKPFLPGEPFRDGSWRLPVVAVTTTDNILTMPDAVWVAAMHTLKESMEIKSMHLAGVISVLALHPQMPSYARASLAFIAMSALFSSGSKAFSALAALVTPASNMSQKSKRALVIFAQDSAHDFIIPLMQAAACAHHQHLSYSEAVGLLQAGAESDVTEAIKSAHCIPPPTDSQGHIDCDVCSRCSAVLAGSTAKCTPQRGICSITSVAAVHKMLRKCSMCDTYCCQSTMVGQECVHHANLDVRVNDDTDLWQAWLSQSNTSIAKLGSLLCIPTFDEPDKLKHLPSVCAVVGESNGNLLLSYLDNCVQNTPVEYVDGAKEELLHRIAKKDYFDISIDMAEKMPKLESKLVVWRLGRKVAKRVPCMSPEPATTEQINLIFDAFTVANAKVKDHTHSMQIRTELNRQIYRILRGDTSTRLVKRVQTPTKTDNFGQKRVQAELAVAQAVERREYVFGLQNSERVLVDEREQDITSHYICPITNDIMTDPVITADGHTYERAAIERWLAGSSMSPLTGLELKHTDLTPNFIMRGLLQAGFGH